MACTLNSSPPCGLQYVSQRAQLEATLRLLCAVADNLGVEVDCGDWNSVLESARDEGLTCLSAGQLRAKTAQQVCEGLDVDCRDLDCFQVSDIQAMIALLTCQVVDSLNP